MNMHELFSEWYGSVYPNPTSEILEKRWAVIEAIAVELTPAQAAKLAALCICKSTDQELIDLLNGRFKSDDSSFNVRANVQGLRALGAGILVRMMDDSKSKAAVLVSLGIHCASFGKKKVEHFTADLIKTANKFLHDKAQQARNRSPINTSLLKFKEPEGTDAATQALNLSKLTQKSLATMIVKLSNDFDLLAEESNMFWWLAGESSIELNKPLAELPYPAMLLLAAKEIADLTAFRPGPISAKAIIARTSRSINSKSSGTHSLKDTINSIPNDWLSTVLKLGNDALDALTPLSVAIRKRIESGNKTAWQSAFSTKTKISVSEQFTDNDLAYQYYQECLLNAEYAMSSEA